VSRVPSRPSWSFLAALGAVVLLMAWTLFALGQLRRASQWVTHTDEVRLGVSRLENGLIDAETSQRGYLVTGEPVFVSRYERAKADWSSAFDAVQRLTADNPRQQNRLAVVHKLIGRRFDEMSDTMNARDRGVPSSRLASELLEGERHSEELRGAIGAVLGEEETLERERQRSAAFRERLLFGGLAAASLGLVGLGVSGLVRRREEVRRLLLLQRIEDDQARLRFMTDTLPQLIWAARPDGWVEYVNRPWLDYTGMTPEQSLGSGWRAAMHPADVDRCVEAWNRSMASGDPYQTEVRVRRADGAYRWHLARAFAQRSADGAILRWFGTAKDIDDARRDKELAEAASRMKDEFLATLSHELRTPLHAVLSWASLLKRVGVDATKREHAVDVIERSARAQATLVEDLLDASRIVSGKLWLKVRRVDLPGVLRAAADVVKPAADAKGLEMRIDIEPEVGTMVGDPGRLQQVAWNLLINAVKFTKSGGRIVLSAHRTGSSINIDVSDTGIGIAPEHLPFLFDRFHQADSSTTRTYAGLGLGLAIVRHLVEAHGGTLAARSAGPGLGATFTVTLPIQAAVAPEAAAMESEAGVESGTESATRLRVAHDGAEPGESPLHGVRALVVEDDPDSLELLQTMLQIAGAGVTTAMSAPEALEAASRTTFDVVISDIGMPEMNGYAFMKLFRSRYSSTAPAIALTAYATAADVERARRAGYQRHIAKPTDYRQLVDAVTETIAGLSASGKVS